MGIARYTTLMVTVALALLLGLGFADPANTRLMPSFFSTAPVGVVPRGSPEEIEILATIRRFNMDLAAAYRALDASRIAATPMDADLRASHELEIDFLRKDGRALEMQVSDIRMTELVRRENRSYRADTIESVTVRYLNAMDSSELARMDAARYVMSYSLDLVEGAWRVVTVDTLETGRHGN